MTVTLFGHIGGKTRLAPLILSALGRFDRLQYREPFFGGGAIGLHVMDHGGKDIWVNDIDVGTTASGCPSSIFRNELKSLVNDFKPSTKRFIELKSFLLSGSVVVTNEDIIRSASLNSLVIRCRFHR